MSKATRAERRARRARENTLWLDSEPPGRLPYIPLPKRDCLHVHRETAWVTVWVRLADGPIGWVDVRAEVEWCLDCNGVLGTWWPEGVSASA